MYISAEITCTHAIYVCTTAEITYIKNSGKEVANYLRYKSQSSNYMATYIHGMQLVR